MRERNEIFSPPLERIRGLALAETVYERLRREIVEGRWRVGDRLPGTADLAKRAGVSRSPVAAALRRLETEGYVERRARSGTFLISTAPAGRPPSGTVAIVVPVERQTVSPSDRWVLQELIHQGAMRHFAAHVVHLPSEGLAEPISALTDLGGPTLRGAVFLHPNRFPPDSPVKHTRLPCVYLEPEAIEPPPGRIPWVGPDLCQGAYALTAHLVAWGHRRIGIAAPGGQTERHAASLDGCREALGRSGIAPWAIEEIQPALPDDSPLWEATAWVCLGNGGEMALEAARARGLSVPGDLSIVAMSRAPLDSQETGREVTRVDYDLGAMAGACLDGLARQEESNGWGFSRLCTSPSLFEGASVTAPKRLA